MNSMNRIVSVAVAAGILGVAFSSQAGAGCTYPSGNEAPAAGISRDDFGGVRVIRTSAVSLADSEPVRAPIVGLWKFEMLAKSTATNHNPMPDGTLIDFGTAAWHSDGTELMNSGLRNPSDGDFCQGVWAAASGTTFLLNHYALAWTNGAYTGPANIRQKVTVDATGSRYTGTFTLVQYLASTTPGHEFDQTTALVSITGTVTATRITAN